MLMADGHLDLLGIYSSYYERVARYIANTTKSKVHKTPNYGLIGLSSCVISSLM